jgi:O-antigen/teichoic acid export membrane protein
VMDVLDTEQAGPAAVRGGTLRFVGYFVTVALSIGSAAILFRHLGVADTGRYVTVLSLVAIVAGLTEAGLSAIGVRELVVRDRLSGRTLVRDLLGIRVVFTGAGVVVATAFAAAAGYGGVLVAGVALAGFGLVLQNLQSTLALPLQAELRFGWVVAADLVRQLTLVASIVGLVLAGSELLPFLATPIPSAAAALVVTAALVRPSVPLKPSFRFRRWGALLKETLPYAIAGAVVTVYFRVTIVVVSLVATERATGLFGASFRIVDVLIVVPQLVAGAAFPIFARAARDDHARLAYGFQRLFDVSLILGVWFALALLLGAGFAIEVVAGPEFSAAADVLRIQGLALIASFVAGAVGFVLLSLKMYRALMVTSLVALITTAALAAVLASASGAEGAAVATVVGEGVLAAGSVVALRRAYLNLTPSLAASPRIALAATPGVLLHLVGGIPDVAGVALATVAYFALLLGLRAIPDEALAEVRRLRAR